MKGFIFSIGLLLLGSLVTMFIVNASTEQYKHDSVVAAMVESGKTATVQALDNSGRVYKDLVVMSKDIFEQSFETAFEQNLNINKEIAFISYDYFTTDNDMKAVKVNVEDGDGQNYSAVFRQNINEE